MPHERKMPGYKDKVGKLSAAMIRLDTGDLAELRRMKRGGPGCAAFWTLAAECDFIDETSRTDAWMEIVKVMAILTPKGGPTKRVSIHDPKRGFGTVLCDGGDPAWNPTVKPLLPETRLMRFFAEPPGRRAASVERVARMLAANRKSESGFDFTEIAALLLFSNNEFTIRDIARAYYRRLDSAAHEARQKENA